MSDHQGNDDIGQPREQRSHTDPLATRFFGHQVCKRAQTTNCGITSPQDHDWRHLLQESLREGCIETDGAADKQSACSINAFAEGVNAIANFLAVQFLKRYGSGLRPVRDRVGGATRKQRNIAGSKRDRDVAGPLENALPLDNKVEANAILKRKVDAPGIT
jgi:hypothetical protein